MKTLKLFSVASSLFCALAFTACNSNNKPSQENPDKTVSSDVATHSDTTPQISRDSIARGTIVTPSTSTVTR